VREVQKLLRLGERYTAERLGAACARSLAYELVDVRRLERIIVLGIEGDPAVDEPLSAAQVLPSRFARPGSGVRSSLCISHELRIGRGAGMNSGVDPDLMRLLKWLKLGQLVPTLPERLAPARACNCIAPRSLRCRRPTAASSASTRLGIGPAHARSVPPACVLLRTLQPCERSGK
jgi:hypothetical protein